MSPRLVARLSVIRIAFNLFYIFAGAPAYSHYPIAYALFYFVIVSLSSIILYKEIFREEAYFIQERFALKLIKRWNSTKKIPSNLKEIYYTYINENQSKKERLSAYKNSIIDLMQEGILNQESIQILEKLREQIGISKIDHNNVMQLIKLKNKNLFDPSEDKSIEQKYQQKNYKQVIERALKEETDVDKTYLKSLQEQFCISDAVHSKIMHSILNSNDQIHQDILNLLDRIHDLILLKNSIYEDGTREINFLKYSIKNEFTFTSKSLFSTLFTIYHNNKKTLKCILNLAKGNSVEDGFSLNKETLYFMEESIAEKMLLISQDFNNKVLPSNDANNKFIIQKLLTHNSLQIAIAALLNTKSNTLEFLTQNILDRFCNTNDIDILTLLYKLKYKTNSITTYERMMYLNSIPLFSNLKFDDLYQLGKSTQVSRYLTDEYIIKQGGVGSTLYVLIKGEAVVEVNGKEISVMGHREYFGEIALLGDTKRTASVKVSMPTTTLSITKKDFKLFLQEHPKVSTKVIKEIIKKLI